MKTEKLKMLIIKYWIEFLIAVLTAVGATIGLTSCGVTTAKIYNPNNGTQTSITISTNNPTSVEVEPNTNFNYNK